MFVFKLVAIYHHSRKNYDDGDDDDTNAVFYTCRWKGLSGSNRFKFQKHKHLDSLRYQKQQINKNTLNFKSFFTMQQ